MEWIRISKHADLDAVLRLALSELEFNTVSGAGHRDKQNRLITLVGFKNRGERTLQLLGITYAEKPDLQVKAVDLIAEIFADRYFNQSIYTWLPPTLERKWEDNPYLPVKDNPTKETNHD